MSSAPTCVATLLLIAGRGFLLRSDRLEATEELAEPLAGSRIKYTFSGEYVGRSSSVRC